MRNGDGMYHVRRIGVLDVIAVFSVVTSGLQVCPLSVIECWGSHWYEIGVYHVPGRGCQVSMLCAVMRIGGLPVSPPFCYGMFGAPSDEKWGRNVPCQKSRGVRCHRCV